MMHSVCHYINRKLEETLLRLHLFYPFLPRWNKPLPFSFLLFYIIYTFILSYYLRKSENQESKMASRFGFQSTTMIVTNTPAADLALTNLAYCSPSDLHNFAVPGTKLFLALVADSSVLSFSYPWIYGIVFLIN